jgi:hypothetical protein
MKIRTVIFLTAPLIFFACAAEFNILSSDVPSAVQSSFSAKYPGAESVKWEAEKEDGHLVFEAEFKQDGKKKEALFAPDGSFVKEE